MIVSLCKYGEKSHFQRIFIWVIFSDKEEEEEPTHYEDAEYDILGKHTGENLMIFAAVKK